MATLTPMQVAAAAYLGGFRGGQIAEAVAVAKGESAFNTESSNACCQGLWQIHRTAHADKIAKVGGVAALSKPAVNAKLAYEIYGGDWCGGRAPNGHCKKYEAYGLSDANGTWAQKMATGKTAKDNLDKRVSSLQIHDTFTNRQISGPMSYRTACEQILKDAGVAADGGGPEWQAGADLGKQIGIPDFFQFPQIEGFAKALTQGSTWLRVAEVALGALLITVGIVQLTGASSLLPAGKVGKIAKVLK